MIGTNGIPNYLRLLSSDQMGGIIVKLGWQMATLPALLRAIFPTGSASAAILADGILLIAYVHRVRTLDLSDAFALTIAVTVLATPYLFLYDSTVLLIPVTVALAKYPRSSGTAWIVAAGYALLSTAILRCSLFGGYPYPLSLLGAPWAAVAVVALALVLGRGAATSDPRMITG
jgi:hypothetical protein